MCKFIMRIKNKINVNYYVIKFVRIIHEKDTYDVIQSYIAKLFNDRLKDMTDSNKPLILNEVKMINFK